MYMRICRVRTFWCLSDWRRFEVSDAGGVHYWCPVDAPIEVLGGKWKLVILYYLLHGPRPER